MSETRCDHCNQVIEHDQDQFAVSWRPKGSYLYAVDLDLCSTECLAATSAKAAREEGRDQQRREAPDAQSPRRKWWQGWAA